MSEGLQLVAIWGGFALCCALMVAVVERRSIWGVLAGWGRALGRGAVALGAALLPGRRSERERDPHLDALTDWFLENDDVTQEAYEAEVARHLARQERPAGARPTLPPPKPSDAARSARPAPSRPNPGERTTY
jgi:hypothetical protein